jgi:hypothetical protein
MLCGISPAFAGLFPIGGQIAHVLRTRAPCTHPPALRQGNCALDLHVLSTPPAFVLSQDQTLV